MSGGLADDYNEKSEQEEKEQKKIKAKLKKKLKSKKGITLLIESFAHHASFDMTTSFSHGNFTLKQIARDILGDEK